MLERVVLRWEEQLSCPVSTVLGVFLVYTEFHTLLIIHFGAHCSNLGSQPIINMHL